jgi:hypothetical protein
MRFRFQYEFCMRIKFGLIESALNIPEVKRSVNRGIIRYCILTKIWKYAILESPIIFGREH